MSWLRKKIKILLEINWIQTIYFNYKYFSFETAIHFPVFVYRHTLFNELGGKVRVAGPISTGMIRLGIPVIGCQDKQFSRTVWEVRGSIIVSKGVYIGRGCRISVEKEGALYFGQDSKINGDSTIICYKNIVIGANCLLSWDILIMDTDYHSISAIGETTILNNSEPIMIGDHVWVGCRCTLLKGTSIPSGSIVAAGSIVSNMLSETNCVYGGVGKDLRIIKERVYWR